MSRVILVRHGQASFGTANYDCLSEKGVAQAQHLGRVLHERGETIDGLWSGTMQRHLQTAQGLIDGGIQTSRLSALAGFNEFDHEQVIARYEPRYADHKVLWDDMARSASPREAFANVFRAAMTRWSSGDYDADYDEPWRVFQARCQQALSDVLNAISGDQTHIVVTSGGVISVLAQPLLGLSDHAAQQVNWTLANASLTSIQSSSRGKPLLLSLNEHGHFRGHHHSLLTWR